MTKSVKVVIIMPILIVTAEALVIYKLLDTDIEGNIIPRNNFHFMDSGSNSVFAQGTWMSDTELAYPINSIELVCFRDLMLFDGRKEVNNL